MSVAKWHHDNLIKNWQIAVWLSIAAILVSSRARADDAMNTLSRMSLAELSNVAVTSVSKVPESLRSAPAAIFVISRADIARSGATSLPEVLRLAPNLLVSQLTSSNYVVAARGLGGNPDLQNFANKLLILIDGRSVYSPLFSGIYNDAQDAVLEDIERIEVISGPGATLWGANAMNGVVNIITRSAYATEGGFASAAGGNQEQNSNLRYGGELNDEASYRVYGKGFRRDAMELDDGSSAEDDWYKGQGGFRLDWQRASNSLTVQGDAYRGLERQYNAGKVSISGANALTRYNHRSGSSDIQLQVYFDRTSRDAPGDGVAFSLDTYDVELQHTFTFGQRHRVVWGAGQRFNSYSIDNSTTLLFFPNERTLTISNFFGQDTFTLTDTLKLTLGLKLENYTFSDWEAQPDARLAWQATKSTMLWVAASRAIRAPTPFDHDVVERVGETDFLIGNSRFHTETVNTYEVGYRGDVGSIFSISISTFFNTYDDLRTIEPQTLTFVPLRWDNLMKGNSYGLTAWAKWQITPWWRVSPGFTVLRKSLKFNQSASRLTGVAQAGNDPSSHAIITSAMNLPYNLTFDTSLRYVAALPSPSLPHYYEMGARLAWRASSALELSIAGMNLLHAHHREYPSPAGEEISRAVIGEIRWRF